MQQHFWKRNYFWEIKAFWTCRCVLCFGHVVAVQLFEICFLSFLCFGLFFQKSPPDYLQGIQITCAQGSGLLIEEWRQLGAFPSQPIRVWRRPSLRRLKRGGEGTQVALTLILNLFHNHWEPHSPLVWHPQTLVCLGVFLAAPHHSSEGTVLALGTPWNPIAIPICLLVYCCEHWTFPPRFTCFLFKFVCRLVWPESILLPVLPQCHLWTWNVVSSEMLLLSKKACVWWNIAVAKAQLTLA